MPFSRGTPNEPFDVVSEEITMGKTGTSRLSLGPGVSHLIVYEKSRMYKLKPCSNRRKRSDISKITFGRKRSCFTRKGLFLKRNRLNKSISATKRTNVLVLMNVNLISNPDNKGSLIGNKIIA
jgi:hypothetical protein